MIRDARTLLPPNATTAMTPRTLSAFPFIVKTSATAARLVARHTFRSTLAPPPSKLLVPVAVAENQPDENRMTQTFTEHSARLGEFIHRSSSPSWIATSLAQADDLFNQLALGLFALQYDSVSPYRNLCDTRQTTPKSVSHWTEIPAVPTRAFKELELTGLPRGQRTRVFHS